jgi:lipopolysaccharide/colanic/teichoic acid biosynthesis glycosyltransferase
MQIDKRASMRSEARRSNTVDTLNELVTAQLIKTGIPRGLEIAISVLGLTLSLPLLVLSSLAIAISSSGPVIFRQKRVGRYGQLFVLYKLRTMRPMHEGPEVTASGDERVTWVGRILRRTKVDELPELWNVVKGDMSLVGPRPEVPRYVDLEDERWGLVLNTRPGLTDPVTLILRNEEALLSEVKGNREYFYIETLQPFKLQGYIDYLHHRTFLTDIKVLSRTLLVIVGFKANTSLQDDLSMLAAKNGKDSCH